MTAWSYATLEEAWGASPVAGTKKKRGSGACSSRKSGRPRTRHDPAVNAYEGVNPAFFHEHAPPAQRGLQQHGSDFDLQYDLQLRREMDSYARSVDDGDADPPRADEHPARADEPPPRADEPPPRGGDRPRGSGRTRRIDRPRGSDRPHAGRGEAAAPYEQSYEFDATSYIDLGLYAVSGIILIFVMEQFIHLGARFP